MSWLVLPLALFAPGTNKARKRRCQKLVRLGFVAFHDYMRVLGLITYNPRTSRMNLPDGPYVMVANHPTLVDVTAILSAHGDLACVVKEELFHGPMVGRLLRICGHINGGDGSPLSGGSVVHQALDRLAEGQPVLIFPEGSRSPQLGLRKFYRGAFEIARRANVPVVPVLITCSPPTLMKGQRWYKVPHRMADLVLRRVDGAGVEDGPKSSKALAARFQKLYEERLGPFWEAAKEELEEMCHG